MANISLVKLPDGTLRGMSERDQLAYARFKSRLKNAEAGEVIEIEAKLPRNSRFHRKFFSLLNLAYEAWEPDRVRQQYKGLPVQKNFERFRSDVTIAAGFYIQTFDLEGNMKLEAKSISFANMEDDEFEQLYSAVVNVVLGKILTTYKDRGELDEVVAQVMRFAQ